MVQWWLGGVGLAAVQWVTLALVARRLRRRQWWWGGGLAFLHYALTFGGAAYLANGAIHGGRASLWGLLGGYGLTTAIAVMVTGGRVVWIRSTSEG